MRSVGASPMSLRCGTSGRPAPAPSHRWSWSVLSLAAWLTESPSIGRRRSMTGSSVGLLLLAMHRRPGPASPAPLARIAGAAAPSLKLGATESEIPTFAEDVGPMSGLAIAGAERAQTMRSIEPAGSRPGNCRSGPLDLPRRVNLLERRDFLPRQPVWVMDDKLGQASQPLVALSSNMDAFLHPPENPRAPRLPFQRLRDLTQN